MQREIQTKNMLAQDTTYETSAPMPSAVGHVSDVCKLIRQYFPLVNKDLLSWNLNTNSDLRSPAPESKDAHEDKSVNQLTEIDDSLSTFSLFRDALLCKTKELCENVSDNSNNSVPMALNEPASTDTDDIPNETYDPFMDTVSLSTSVEDLQMYIQDASSYSTSQCKGAPDILLMSANAIDGSNRDHNDEPFFYDGSVESVDDITFTSDSEDRSRTTSSSSLDSGYESDSARMSNAARPVQRARQVRKRHMKERKCPNKCIHLWEFLRDLLNNEEYRNIIIEWTSEDKKEFRLLNSSKVAELWGERKHKKGMTYEKMARSLRYYYKLKIMEKIPNKRLHFRFGQENVWKKM